MHDSERARRRTRTNPGSRSGRKKRTSRWASSTKQQRSSIRPCANRPRADNLSTGRSLPDWRGVYTRAPVAGFAFDPEQPEGGVPTAKLTPEYEERMRKRIEGVKQGIEWDPISTCAPPGHPAVVD